MHAIRVEIESRIDVADERVLRETYVNIDWEAERVSQASVDSIKCLRDLGGKVSRYQVLAPTSFSGDERKAA